MTDQLFTPADIVSKLIEQRRPRPAIGVYSPPQDEVECALAEIWSEVLRIDKIGRDDNLFDLGGDSLHITQIATRIRRRLKMLISIEIFFENLSVAELATVFRSGKSEA